MNNKARANIDRADFLCQNSPGENLIGLNCSAFARHQGTSGDLIIGGGMDKDIARFIEQYKRKDAVNIWLIAALITLWIAALAMLATSSFADEYSNDQIADAIYIAEGGANTNHPYGILAKYKTTTPRQACINTIIHARKDWDGKGDFIEFLGSRYCPIGAKNDPTGLNKNWVKNVRGSL